MDELLDMDELLTEGGSGRLNEAEELYAYHILPQWHEDAFHNRESDFGRIEDALDLAGIDLDVLPTSDLREWQEVRMSNYTPGQTNFHHPLMERVCGIDSIHHKMSCELRARIKPVAAPMVADAMCIAHSAGVITRSPHMTRASMASVPWSAGLWDFHDSALIETFAAISSLTDEEQGAIMAYLTLRQESAASICSDDKLIVLARPKVVVRDNAGRFHGGRGPAIFWPSGEHEFFWRGEYVSSSAWIERIKNPDTVRPENVIRSFGSNQNRLADIAGGWGAIVKKMIERHSFDVHYRTPDGMTIYSNISSSLRLARGRSDEYGTMWYLYDEESYGSSIGSFHDGANAFRDHPDLIIALVEVVDATPLEDGAREHHWLRVPPHMKQPKRAVAWTFGLTADEYDPSAES